MPDIRIMRQKVDVKIKLWPPDMADIVTQPEVLSGFNKEELENIINKATEEYKTRKEKEENGIIEA